MTQACLLPPFPLPCSAAGSHFFAHQKISGLEDVVVGAAGAEVVCPVQLIARNRQRCFPVDT